MNCRYLFTSLFVALAACGINAQPVVHPEIGTTITTDDGAVTVRLMDKRQNYGDGGETKDVDINSPKSVNIHPDGKKYYVNSLEGATTVIYDLEGSRKRGIIKHSFDETADAALWAAPSGLFPWTHYHDKVNTFYGKPVESTFSHNGRYLWVPYYRRSFDINAQDPSAVAIIDTESDKIIRLMETGPLPKMITTSPDGTIVAISHWGDNTVGLIDISSNKPEEWKYISKLVVDYQLKLNYPLNTSVNRDSGSGYALRGTVFTPDNKYLLVGCMGGGGGIAVIDVATRQYLGRVMGMMDNVRHIVLSNGYLYLSINTNGVVQRTKLSTFLEAAKNIRNKIGHCAEWESVNVGKGARTICLTPNGRYLFAACNIASKLYVIDTNTMAVIGAIDADSYPVGLEVSEDGRYVLMTSQGRTNNGVSGGGNCVDIFEVTYKEDVSVKRCISCGGELDKTTHKCLSCGLDIVREDTQEAAPDANTEKESLLADDNSKTTIIAACGAGVLLCIAGGVWYKKRS